MNDPKTKNCSKEVILSVHAVVSEIGHAFDAVVDEHYLVNRHVDEKWTVEKRSATTEAEWVNGPVLKRDKAGKA